MWSGGGWKGERAGGGLLWRWRGGASAWRAGRLFAGLEERKSPGRVTPPPLAPAQIGGTHAQSLDSVHRPAVDVITDGHPPLFFSPRKPRGRAAESKRAGGWRAPTAAAARLAGHTKKRKIGMGRSTEGTMIRADPRCWFRWLFSANQAPFFCLACALATPTARSSPPTAPCPPTEENNKSLPTRRAKTPAHQIPSSTSPLLDRSASRVLAIWAN